MITGNHVNFFKLLHQIMAFYI